MSKSHSSISLFSSRIKIAVFAILALIGTGTIGYRFIEGYQPIDAFYMTVITMSTVGFEEVNPLSANGKLFTSFLIILSFSTFAYAISVITTYFVTGQFRNTLLQRKMINKIEHLSGHIILCGAGRVGRKTAKKLEGYNQDFVLIEKSQDRLDAMASDQNFLSINSDATSDSALLSAGIKKATALITTLPSDADNLYVVLTARELNKNLKIICRASQHESIRKMKIAGANNVIMPDSVGGSHMASLVVNPDIMEFIDHVSIQGAGEVNLEEIVLENLNKFPQGKSIKEINQFSELNLNVIGCKKDSGEILINPDKNAKLELSDKLFVLGMPDAIKEFETQFQ